MGKYDNLIYRIPAEHHSWQHYVSPRCGYPGTRVDPEATINFGFSVAYDENVMEEPHMHDAKEEYLFFTGTDLEHFFESWDAEVEVWLGDDPRHMEKLTLTAPAIIRVPPKMWHTPINFKRVGKPVCFIPFYLDGSWCKIIRDDTQDGKEHYTVVGEGLRHCVYNQDKLCEYCGKCFSEQAKAEPMTTEQYLLPYREMEKQPRTGKYDKYVYYFKPEYHQWDALISPRAGMAGEDDMPGSKLYFGYDIVVKPFTLDDAHIHHSVTEYLMVTGADLMDPFSSFDAEITIMLGEDPDHMEEYTITEPAIIRIPPHFWHCPINFKRVGKPVNFIPWYPDGIFSRISRQYLTGDGRPTFVYDAVGLVRCKYDQNKVCEFCGKCYSEAAKEAVKE